MGAQSAVILKNPTWQHGYVGDIDARYLLDMHLRYQVTVDSSAQYQTTSTIRDALSLTFPAY